MNKRIFQDEFPSFALKSGQVIVLRDKETEKITSLMVIVDTPVGQMAIAEMRKHDTIVTSEYTLANYCVINREEYPDTLGIDPVFGNEVTSIYPHLGFCFPEDGDIYEVVYEDADGLLHTKML